jgi:hypothetical protein
MRKSFWGLLLGLIVFIMGFSGPGSCSEDAPPLQLLPDQQQGQGSPMAPSSPSVTETLHDIRGPVDLPDSTGVLIWLLIGLAVVFLAGLLFYLWKHRKNGRLKQPQPHEIALLELAGLRSMMNPAQALLYAAQLSELLRRYIEARFQIHSTRQTTREFFGSLVENSQVSHDLKDHQAHLQACLEECDMAKFAHYSPDQQGMAAMEQAVLGFIEATGPAVTDKGQE